MTTIAIDARLNYYRQGGIALYTRRVIEALAGLDDDPATTYRILHSRKDAQSYTPGQNFRRHNLWTPCHHRLERWALAVELLPLRLNLLHSPDFIPPLAGGERYVITVHDLNFLHYPQFLTDASRRYYNGQIERAVRQAAHILADSEATKADMVNLLAVPPDKITVHMLGVEPEFRPLPDDEIDAACQALNVPRGGILFVGTFEPRKNIPGLLQAYHALRAELPDAPPLLLVGFRGWLADDLDARVADMGLMQHVIWLEDTPREYLPALYNAASVLVTPSFYEGFGLPALEAMACGTPTLVSDRSSLPEVVGDTGLLADPDDPAAIAEGLRRLLTESALRERSRAAGLARAATFTWDETGRIVHRVYQQVLAM